MFSLCFQEFQPSVLNLFRTEGRGCTLDSEAFYLKNQRLHRRSAPEDGTAKHRLGDTSALFLPLSGMGERIPGKAGGGVDDDRLLTG